MIRAVAGLTVVWSIAAGAQTSAAPAFEVASIRVSEPGKETIDVAPGSLTMRHASLTTCIRWAYSVPEFQVAGAGWLDEVSFDAVAKAGTPVKEAELRVMMQTLLADRLRLACHRERKEISALVLTVGKNGHKLRPVETEEPPSFNTGKLTLAGQGATLNQLTEFLSRAIRVPIIDQTGLTGRFNYALDINSYVTDEMRNQGPPLEAPSIIAQAMQAQLGLKLDSKKVLVEMVVVDHVERKPTEN